MLHYISTGKVKKAILFEGLLISQKKNPTWKKLPKSFFYSQILKRSLQFFQEGLIELTLKILGTILI